MIDLERQHQHLHHYLKNSSCNPFLEWLAGLLRNLSNVTNQRNIDSNSAALTFILSVNGSLRVLCLRNNTGIKDWTRQPLTNPRLTSRILFICLSRKNTLFSRYTHPLTLKCLSKVHGWWTSMTRTIKRSVTWCNLILSVDNVAWNAQLYCEPQGCLVTAHKQSMRRLCFHRCLSVHGGGVCIQEELGRPPHWIPRDTVYERAVRIVLDCILVFFSLNTQHLPSLLVATIATEDQKYWRRIHRSCTSSSSWAVRRRCRLCGCSPDSGSVSTSPAPFPTHWNENSEG